MTGHGPTVKHCMKKTMNTTASAVYVCDSYRKEILQFRCGSSLAERSHRSVLNFFVFSGSDVRAGKNVWFAIFAVFTFRSLQNCLFSISIVFSVFLQFFHVFQFLTVPFQFFCRGMQSCPLSMEKCCFSIKACHNRVYW